MENQQSLDGYSIYEARAVPAALLFCFNAAISVFAAEHGLDPQRLYSWRRRLGKAERTAFAELIVQPPPRISVTDGDAAFEIALPSGVVVRVPASFSTAALERLLEVLRAGGC
jgi:transposase-like protein